MPRCANIYSGDDLKWPRIIPGTIRSLLLGDDSIIRSDGSPKRDYMHVEDAVDAHLLRAQRAGEDGIRGTGFNFGSGKPVIALDLVV